MSFIDSMWSFQTKKASPLPKPALSRRKPFDPRIRVVCDENEGYRVTTHPKDPNGFQRIYYRLSNGTRITLYKAAAENETIRVFGLTGYKTDYLLSPQRIKEAQRNGISHYWLALPNTYRENILHAPLYTETAKLLIKIAYKMRNEASNDAKQILMGHSTGARFNLEIAQQDDVFKAIQETFAGFIASSAFLDSANASHWFYPKRARFWADFCEKHAHLLPDEHVFSQNYLRFFGEDSTPAHVKGYMHPTFGQIKDLTQGGFALAERIEKDSHPFKTENFPVASFISTRDGFSSPKTNERTALSLGASQVSLIASDHSPISVSQLVAAHYREIIQAMVRGDFSAAVHSKIIDDTALPITQSLISPFIEAAKETPTNTPSRLRSFSSGGTGQGGTGLLDTFTRRAQSLLGGGVGNAEVGAETESSTVNGSYALRL
jgi:alpha-beta hydrolase superfamily lysophospholipase